MKTKNNDLAIGLTLYAFITLAALLAVAPLRMLPPGPLLAGWLVPALLYAAYCVFLRHGEARRELAEKNGRLDRAAQRLTEAEGEIQNWLRPGVVIDSAILADAGAARFLDVLAHCCRKNKASIVVYDAQLDEFERAAAGAKAAGEDDSDASISAGRALRRIEALQNRGLVTVAEIDLEQKYASSSPLIIKLLRKLAGDGTACCFITADEGLRIRARGGADHGDCRVVEDLSALIRLADAAHPALRKRYLSTETANAPSARATAVRE